MRLIRFINVETGQPITAVDCNDGTALPLAGSALNTLEPAGDPIPFLPDSLLAPLHPTTIMGIGLNYRNHAEEQGKTAPSRPMMFMKNISAVVGPFDDITVPRVCQDVEQVDFECELAVIIGKAARDVTVENALDYVLGYTVANDISARWWQKEAGGGQFCRGKSFDTFCPIGPCIISSDEIPDPQTLRLTTRINGETMQDSTTGDMIFSVAELIAFLSQGTTLQPGTLLLTGTPEGVGFARNPKRFLHDGDTLETEVQNIGVLYNTIRFES